MVALIFHLRHSCPWTRPGNAIAMGDIFRSRLSDAIDHLQSHQLWIAALRARHPGITGTRALVAAAAGMPSPTTLSDILSGRMPGTSYRGQLAEVLHVDRDWLDGAGGEPPDWALHPIMAWRRYADRLRKRADSQDDDTSFSHDEMARMRTRFRAIAGTYGIDVRSPWPEALVTGRFEAVPFDLVLRHAHHCGLADPDHPDHVGQGHAEWCAMRADLTKEVMAARDKVLRYVPPPRLFEIIRATLRDAKGKRDDTAIEDALEFLLRQQWVAGGKQREDGVPDSFVDDTGRSEWSTMRALRTRWSL